MMTRLMVLPGLVAVLLLAVVATNGAGESNDGKQRKQVPHSGGLSDLPNPIPKMVDGLSRSTEDLRKGAGKAASKGANSISVLGDNDKKK